MLFCPFCRGVQRFADAFLGYLNKVAHFLCRLCDSDWSQEPYEGEETNDE